MLFNIFQIISKFEFSTFFNTIYYVILHTNNNYYPGFPKLKHMLREDFHILSSEPTTRSFLNNLCQLTQTENDAHGIEKLLLKLK